MLTVLLAGGALTAAAQDRGEQFGALTLEKGLPTLFGENFRRTVTAEVPGVRSTEIPTGMEGHVVAYYGGVAAAERKRSDWLWHEQPDGSGVLRRIEFEENDWGHLAATAPLYMDSSRTEEMPLELRLLPESNVLLFRWTGLSGSIAGGMASPRPVDRPVVLGKTLPAFVAERLNGGSFSSESSAGHHLVINTWALDCAPCIAEMPGLNELRAKYQDANVAFLALGNDPADDIRRFLSNHEFGYEHALFNNQVRVLFGETFPRNLIVNSDGVVVYDETGANAEQHRELETVIQELLLRAK